MKPLTLLTPVVMAFAIGMRKAEDRIVEQLRTSGALTVVGLVLIASFVAWLTGAADF